MTAFVESTITFPYRRSLGPVIGRFMTGLTEMRLVGIRSHQRVIVPPLEWDPDTGEELAHDFVEVGPAGTVTSWCWVESPTTTQHPLSHPFAFGLIALDGADTSLVHAIDAGTIDAMATGMRVAPRWRPQRTGHISDIEAFVPGEEPVLPSPDGGAATEPVEMMDYNASITYRTPVTINQVRAQVASDEGRFLGLRCPECGRIYVGGRGFCPIDAAELTVEDELDLPQVGTVTNYTIITPVQYAGQTETEPFARINVLLDGVEVVVQYQGLIECPNDQIRIGMRVSAVWASEAEVADNLTVDGNLVGWIPNGEPDVTNPDLVNRII
jgi:uncharacterized OB-fold protein